MSEAPKVIWMPEYDSPESATWGLGAGVPYVRADVVDELIKKYEDKIESLEYELREEQ